MHTYSPFFQTLYNEQKPVGSLGRGTHYSILRAVVFHGEDGQPIPSALSRNARSKYHDFAIIWDEDHDTRVISVIEKIYQNGLLPYFSFFGERKACFTALLYSEQKSISQPNEMAVKILCEEVIDNAYNDVWYSSLGTLIDPQGLIDAKDDDVTLYLKNINMLWKLGSKDIVDNSLPQVMVL